MKANVIPMRTDKKGATQQSIGFFLGGNKGWEQRNLKPNTDYACIMMAIPEGHKLANESEIKEKVSSVESCCHKFEPRYDSVYEGNACWSEIYAHDICVHCGKIIEKGE